MSVLWWNYGMLFAVGLIIGGWVHRAVERLGLQKSFFWPLPAHCGWCWQSVPLYWYIPILGPLIRWGKCPKCQHRLAIRRLLFEVISASILLVLFVVYLQDGKDWWFPDNYLVYDLPRRRALFVYHAILLLLLVVATFIDFDLMIIPDSVTVPGMLIGLILGTMWFVELHPVPVMHTPRGESELSIVSLDQAQSWVRTIPENMRSELERNLPDSVRAINQHWRMHWNRWIGFLTGLAGLLAGGGVVWFVRAVCSWAFGREAMGFGDVTLMAMVGTFLGWQSVLIAFFLAPISAFLWVIGSLPFRRRPELPYGPHLSLASFVVILAWRPLWNRFSTFFADTQIFWSFAGTMAILLVAISLLIAWFRQMSRRLSVSHQPEEFRLEEARDQGESE